MKRAGFVGKPWHADAVEDRLPSDSQEG